MPMCMGGVPKRKPRNDCAGAGEYGIESARAESVGCGVSLSYMASDYSSIVCAHPRLDELDESVASADPSGSATTCGDPKPVELLG